MLASQTLACERCNQPMHPEWTTRPIMALTATTLLLYSHTRPRRSNMGIIIIIIRCLHSLWSHSRPPANHLTIKARQLRYISSTPWQQTGRCCRHPLPPQTLPPRRILTPTYTSKHPIRRLSLLTIQLMHNSPGSHRNNSVVQMYPHLLRPKSQFLPLPERQQPPRSPISRRPLRQPRDEARAQDRL